MGLSGNIALAPGYFKGASGPADFGANKPLVLPNCAGRGLFGMDDMGAGPQGVINSYIMPNPTLVGSVGGTPGESISTSPSCQITR